MGADEEQELIGKKTKEEAQSYHEGHEDYAEEEERKERKEKGGGNIAGVKHVPTPSALCSCLLNARSIYIRFAVGS